MIKNCFSSQNSAQVFVLCSRTSGQKSASHMNSENIMSLLSRVRSGFLSFTVYYFYWIIDYIIVVICIPVKKKNPGRFSHLVPDQRSEIHVGPPAETHFIYNTRKVHTKEQLEKVSSQSQFQLISSLAEGGSERRRRAGPGLLVALGCQR